MTSSDGSWRGDLATAAWLRARDFRARGRHRRIGWWAAAYAAACVLLIAGAAAAHRLASASPAGVDDTTTRHALVWLWLLWAVLPAVGGGGGYVESAAALAPYPASPRLLLLSGCINAALEPQYLVTVPSLTAVLVLTHGLVAVVPVIAFVVGAGCVGQLAGWLAVAGLRAERGQSLAPTVFAAALLGVAFVLHRAGPGAAHLPVGSGWLPAGWLTSACEAGRGAGYVGWCAALLAPALLMVVFGPAAAARGMVARAAGPVPTSRRRGGSARRVRAAAPAAGLGPFRVMLAGTVRAKAFQVALVTSAAVPFVAGLVVPHGDLGTLALLSLFASGAAVGANAWSYDAGGVVLLLAAPVTRVRLVVLRTLVLASCLTAMVAETVGVGVAAGFDWFTGPQAAHVVLVLVVATAAGVQTATRNPSPADVESLRGKPTTTFAAVSYMMRVGAVSTTASLVADVVAGGSGGPWVGSAAALVVGVGYLGWVWWRAGLRLTDGARLVEAFAAGR